MKKRPVLTMLLLSSLLFASISYCEELTEKEMKIYSEFLEGKIYKELANKYAISVDEVIDIIMKGSTRKPFTERDLRIYSDFIGGMDVKKIADKHGIPVFEVADINMRGMARNPIELEWKIFNEMEKKINALPDFSTPEQREEAKNKIFREFANRYRLSFNMIKDIYARVRFVKVWGKSEEQP